MSLQVHIGAIWSGWYAGDHGHCSDQELADVLSGKAPLPPDAHVAYGVSGAVDAPVKVALAISGPDGDGSGTFDPTLPKVDVKSGDSCFMQGQDHGWFKRSRGWNGICGFFPRKSGPNTGSISVTDGSGATASFSFPWIARESDRKS